MLSATQPTPGYHVGTPVNHAVHSVSFHHQVESYTDETMDSRYILYPSDITLRDHNYGHLHDGLQELRR